MSSSFGTKNAIRPNLENLTTHKSLGVGGHFSSFIRTCVTIMPVMVATCPYPDEVTLTSNVIKRGETECIYTIFDQLSVLQPCCHPSQQGEYFRPISF